MTFGLDAEVQSAMLPNRGLSTPEKLERPKAWSETDYP